MKYIIHYSTGYTFSFFSRSLRGAKAEAGKRTAADFFDNKENYISIYEFDKVLPVATKKNNKWINH